MSLLRLFVAFLLAVACSQPAWATPAFARAERHPCEACHTAFPELNAVGRAFKVDGYRMAHDAPGTKEQSMAPDMPMPATADSRASSEPDVPSDRMNLGSGVILDSLPGLAVRVESVVVEVSPDDSGSESVAFIPLDSVELVMAGSNGDHWTYLAELGGEVDDGFTVKGSAVLMFRAARGLTGFTGWTPMFSRDAYNTLSESRRVDHVRHAVQDYVGSTGIDMSAEGGVVGAFGTLGPIFYLAEAGPGPGATISAGEPFDYVGRVGVNATDNIAIGAFVYDGVVADASTIRAGLDSQAITKAGSFKVVAMVDTADTAVLAEVGWNLSSAVQGFWLVPVAHVDVTSVASATTVVPMVGLGVQQSAGRAQIEVSEPLGRPGGPPPPTIRLTVDAVF